MPSPAKKMNASAAGTVGMSAALITLPAWRSARSRDPDASSAERPGAITSVSIAGSVPSSSGNLVATWKYARDFTSIQSRTKYGDRFQ